MRDQLLLLAVGFLLTSVVGGLLGMTFQRRAWEHQHEAHVRESEGAAATKVFEEISSLMDRRQYRMLALDWKLHPGEGQPDPVAVDEARLEYRKLLEDWNNNLNRHLALTLRYFGQGTRARLERIQEAFKAHGERLEADCREFLRNGVVSSASREQDLWPLNDEIYRLNLEMIEMIQEARVGVSPNGPHSGQVNG